MGQPRSAASVLIAVPTGIKIFSWLGTLYFGKVQTRSTSMLFALGLFIGGIECTTSDSSGSTSG